MEFLAVLRRGLQQFTGHGGLRGYLRVFFRSNDAKVGTLVGKDKYGNQYYEDKKQFFATLRYKYNHPPLIENETEAHKIGPMIIIDKALTDTQSIVQLKDPVEMVANYGRHRWVMYTTEMNGKNTFWDVDASMVPPEWHRWLHCMTDDPPTTEPPTDRKFIWKNHKFNVTGTPEQYVPYSTTRKKIHEWVPPSTPYK